MCTRTACAGPTDVNHDPVIAERVGDPLSGAIGKLLRREPGRAEAEPEQDPEGKCFH